MKRKIYSVVTLLLALVMSATMLVACNSGSAKAEVVSKTDTMVVIKVNETEGFAHLIDAMNYLKDDNKLTFELSGTMIVSLDGKDCDTVTWSPFWYLYTSDSEMANTDWGTVTYDGKTYGSAILGADSLEIVAGELYIWEYK